MRREGLKRLEIWLPEGHWLFDLPTGRRAQRVRELLDLAANLEAGMEALRRDVVAEVAALRRDLEALRSRPPEARQASGEAARKFLAAFG
ncbi:MAG: hypothetical protein ACPLRW_11585 [Moorellales bacterium]